MRNNYEIFLSKHLQLFNKLLLVVPSMNTISGHIIEIDEFIFRIKRNKNLLTFRTLIFIFYFSFVSSYSR